MYSEKVKNTKEIMTVLDNLCKDTVVELKAMFGEKYKETVFNEIYAHSTNICSIKLKGTGDVVGLFGLLPQEDKAAGIFLLTTDDLHKGNKILFLRQAKKQIEKWLSEYGLLMDKLYKRNSKIKKWLKLLGFKPSKYQDNVFQIYYKGKLGLYNE